MKTTQISVEQSTRTDAYTVNIGYGLLSGSGTLVRRWLGKEVDRVVIVSNPKVFGLYGARVEESIRSAKFQVSAILIKDGEKYKDLSTAESVLKHFSSIGLQRTDAVVALGGGVIGDLAGFAAAVYLRGVRFVQIPTTLLSMIDSSTGGKTGVNSSFGKNLIGAFHFPVGVLIDPATLQTLPQRELAAGYCEAVKQGAVGGRPLLKQTRDLFSTYPVGEFRKYADEPDLQSRIEALIAKHVAFKAKIVAGDPHESRSRTDGRSRKILNFGHTLAHALEKVTDYKYFKHGEAVGYGILFAAELSKTLALCSHKDVKLLNDVVHSVGPLPTLRNIDPKVAFEAFRSDKKNISGLLQMVLLKGIGKPVIVSEINIPRSTALSVLKQFCKNWS